MDSSYPVVPSGSVSPERRSGGPLTARGATPLHRPGEMTLGEGMLREDYWKSIGPRTRERLAELSGAAIEWFAGPDGSSGDGRPYAVTFGDAGLSIAEPRIDTAHRPVYAISSFQFTPGSLRTVEVDHRPAPHASPSIGSAGTTPPDLGLSEQARGVIGNLPPRAQELLQEPFGAGRKILRSKWYYEGYEHSLTTFMVFLAGAKDVTAATGSKVVPAGHTDATAHWKLFCYQAKVARRIGR